MALQRYVGSLLALAAVLGLLAGCGGAPKQPSGAGGHYKLGRPYQINGRWYEPYYDPAYSATGVASWYGDPFHGRLTANGERYDKRRLSAAHTTLPLPSLVEVTNLNNGRTVELRVNDRGPFVGDRVIDVSEAAAEVLGFKEDGLAQVEIRFLGLLDSTGTPPQPTVPRPATPPTMVAAADPARATAPRAVAPMPCASYALQVGAYTEADEAARVAASLAGRFEPPVRGRSIHADGLSRVRLGPFADLDAAHRGLARVVGAGHRNAFILELDTAGAQCPDRRA